MFNNIKILINHRVFPQMNGLRALKLIVLKINKH